MTAPIQCTHEKIVETKTWPPGYRYTCAACHKEIVLSAYSLVTPDPEPLAETIGQAFGEKWADFVRRRNRRDVGG